MFSSLKKFLKKKKKKNNSQNNKVEHSNQEDFNIELSKNLSEDLLNIEEMLDKPDDLIIRKFSIGETNQACAVVCIDGLVDSESVTKKIIETIQHAKLDKNEKSVDVKKFKEDLTAHILSSQSVNWASTLDDVSLGIHSGDTALYVDGLEEVLIIGTRKWEERGVEEPVTEAVIRGPRDGFTENIRTNTAHVRRRLRDPNLRYETFKVGRRSKNTLILSYIDGIVNPKIVEEAKRRIKSIDVDDVPETGIVEQLIEDSYLSPFPQMHSTERPDKVSAALLEGRVAIFLDGTPFVLLAPATFGQFFQSPEDYYQRFPIQTFVRLLRYVAAFIAVFLPALYIALLSYHPGMIPSKLAFSIAGTREGVPFPAFVEAFLMESMMELLREAGIRLPKPIGQTIGIVGGLIIGEAAVSAGIVSPIMVIIVASTAVASFILPSYGMTLTLRMLKFGSMFAAAMFGLFGIILVYIMINIHITNLKSIGVPYSAPFGPFFKKDWKDMVFKLPESALKDRPKMTKPQDTNRIGKGAKK
ncbi:spore germination protein [Salirhabdus euzebyi]|uniref:Spore germination protein n=1 Tax=Salirhabdus euzebyi TaxID=394506 RepID=A0A841Q4M2_9BACI|nr:spore germination protein [Salirhabdus euzebyi]MBB6453361.1 spore germination protein [Salirhabdus euzebyi]